MTSKESLQAFLRGEIPDCVPGAIENAAQGGGFILSTGDQCERDTPDENLFAMVETTRS